MGKKVTILDYGLGNLFSLANAFHHLGAEITIATHADEIIKAERLVLPGVGSFKAGRQEIGRQGMDELLLQFAQSERPLLGICLGMQMMLTTSYEFGCHQGLNLISGKVIHIDKTALNGQPHKIPHIGWSQISLPGDRQGSWQDTIFAGIEPGVYCYFVHSYMAVPDNPENRLADTRYNGRLISAAIQNNNIYGTQFHPEKSGEIGIKILNNFLRI